MLPHTPGGFPLGGVRLQKKGMWIIYGTAVADGYPNPLLSEKAFPEMSEHQNITEATADLVEVEAERSHLTPSEQILAPLTLSDFSQFLYETNYGGVKGQDFTAEGIKTLGLNNGISTGEVRIEFLNDEKTEALFYCTATDRNGDTSGVMIQQNKKENGRDNPHWIAKGCSRAIRNAMKARLPVQLFKTALQKAIIAGEAKQSAIVEAQHQMSVAWDERDESLCHIKKPSFYAAAQVEYGDADNWDSDTWQQIIIDLTEIADWVKAVRS